VVIHERITIHQPTLDDVIKLGESNYFGVVSALTTISSDIKSALWDVGVSWEDFSDIETFALMLKQINTAHAAIFFGDLDLGKLNLFARDDGDFYLDDGEGTIIDFYLHKQIQTILCQLHGIVKKPEKAGNKYTKQALIDLDRDDRRLNSEKPFKSQLLPLVSGMINSAGFKYKLEEVRAMKLYAFMDSVQRISLIKSVEHLSFAYYGGNIDAKKFNAKDKLNWLVDFTKSDLPSS
jgi:hypothetical protein